MNGMHGIIFSYEKRNDLRELGEIRSASSIPFGGRYRAVDFALSNLVNAGVTDVGVVLHGHYQSLLDHLGTGKDWDLSRKRGGLKILPPFAYKQHWGEAAAFRGKMEALAGVRSYLQEIRRDYVALMDGDLVVNLPLSDIYDQHIKSGADITVVCGNDSFETENGTYFEMDSTGRITDVLYHLHRPRGYRGLEVYILSTKLLLDLVDECATRDQFSLRRDVLQARKDSLKLQGYIWGGFAAQIRSVQEYYDRSMQLLDPAIRAELFCAERPIRAKATDKSSAYIGPDGYCENSLIADGCNIEGVVENSILFPGVVVESGAVVRNCVLFKETAVRRNAAVSYLIADKNVEVLPDRTLMGHSSYPIVLAKGSKV
ncbi:glucose-1-phosphate adenylyltransferase subunit GlgD [Oscillibacter valericigenes]|uniref:glucose-1-phosphate adenylyltransferase subunit GlgD n=1 Tax=Oscillibacter valericigenes TaxID=351091 RepID=UPI00195BEF15|nr:glucose-1-phosphate adenylyltransferase subunit GlgD [Oscillibacter valericigenes]MBM6910162.1 glucose-1-phosphate adenylyltransferase subunit GlgD [Oscillibacter valericigenes]HJB77845.1 glucose-1-phosphate adenylyltransferase subunit GlgD [Candidatus Oscillibacter avistercoris]